MTSVALLPSAALQVILGHLCSSESSARDCTNARLACKRFADISCASVSSVCPKNAAGLVEAVQKFRALQQVDLRYIRSIEFTEAASLAQLRCLRQLSLLDSSCWDSVHASVLGSLARGCPALTHLEISAVTHELAVQLARLTQLQCLGVSGRLSDAGIAELGALQQLQQLSLSCCDAVSNTGLQVLTALTALNSLQLHSCLQLGDAALQLLGQLSQLTSLSLSHSCEDASGAGLLCLSTLKNLRQLNLSATSEGAAPSALAKLLSALPQLTLLDVSYCESVGPAVLRAIGTGLSQLQVLGLSGINPGSLHSLRYLKHLGKLQQLQLRWIGQLKDSHASFLPHLGALTALDLSYCRSLSGEGLQQLQWLTQLRQLNLMAVGSDDLGCLATLQQLTGLTVSLLPHTCKAWQHVAILTQLQSLALRRCMLTTSSSSNGGNNSSSGGNSSGHGDDCAAGGGAANLPGLSCSSLCHLQQLTALDCSGSSLEAFALTMLQQLPQLQHLGLSRCQGVSNTVLGVLGGCSSLRKLDLRLRGSGCSWTLKGLLGLLEQLPGLGAVYLSEVPAGLPEKEVCRVLACSTEQVPLPVARDVGYRLGPGPLFLD